MNELIQELHEGKQVMVTRARRRRADAHGNTWTVVVTPRSIDLARFGLDRDLEEAGCVIRRIRGGPLSSDELSAAWADADAAILGLDCADAAAIRAAPRLRVISRYGVGYDNVDVRAATGLGILVTITATAPKIAVAEFTLTLMLALLRDLPHFIRNRATAANRPIHELSTLTVGLIGFGNIGREVARLANSLGMGVIYFKPASAPSTEVRRVEFDVLLQTADIVSLHVPLTPATKRIIGRKEIASMKLGAYFINTARGGLVDEEALGDALRAGKLAGAALDVREVEPPAPDDPLGSMPNVILTPHIASKTDQSIERMAREAVASLLAVKRGEIPLSGVNPEALHPERT